MEKVKLGDLATFVNGYAFKPTDWKEKGLEIIRIQNLTRSSSEKNFFDGDIPEKYRVKDGDILISWSATLGVYVWRGKDAWLNQHIFKVVFDKKQINKRFFLFLIQNTLVELRKQVHGATMKHITKDKFDDTLVPLPSLPEQKRIAARLDKADELRQYNRQLIEKYGVLTQSLFLDMFGDPVKNEKGWEKGTIRDLCFEVKYGTSQKASNNGAFPYLRMNNITYEGYMDFSDLKYINMEGLNLDKYSVKRGDILFNRTNSKELVGKTGLIQTDERYIIAGYLIRVRVNQLANPFYLWAFLNSKWAKITLKNMCKNIVGMANINAQELQDIKILRPPINLQNKFAERVQLIEQQKQQAQTALDKSEQLFQRLLQDSFK